MNLSDKQKGQLNTLYGTARANILVAAFPFLSDKEAPEMFQFVTDPSRAEAVKELINGDKDLFRDVPREMSLALKDLVQSLNAGDFSQAAASAPAVSPKAPAGNNAAEVSFKPYIAMSHNNNGDAINHPTHYNEWSVEVIDMLEKVYGKAATSQWCEMTAFKYTLRMGFKPGETVEENLAKRDWYLQKSRELAGQ